jgi:lon-related putative ATP-dependent protease
MTRERRQRAGGQGDGGARPGASEGTAAALRLAGKDLRWCCDEDWLDFDSTENVEPIMGVVGQDDAIDALRFGLEVTAPGQNIFVRGLSGTGRMTLIQQLLTEIRPACPLAGDRVYVHNFGERDRPRLITLPRGQGRVFCERIDAFIDFIVNDLRPGLSSDGMRARRRRLDEEAQERMRELGQPFEKELHDASLALVPVQVGQTVQPTILPVVEGKPVPLEGFQKLREEGAISEADAQQVLERIADFEKRFQEISEKIQELQEKHREAVRDLYEQEARALLLRHVTNIEQMFPQEAVKAFLSEVTDDLIARGRQLKDLREELDFTDLYRANLLLGHDPRDGCPIVIENAPTLQNLLGSIGREFAGGGMIRSDHMMIKPGSLLRADGGFLILEARDVLTEPGAWKVLGRTLRTGRLEIVPSEIAMFWAGPLLKPEPIDINVKVVLLGDPDLYYLLDAYDRDFPHQFKVLADFDTTVARDERGVRYYAGVLARIAQQEKLPPFTRCAVGALCEHGARIAARRDRLTTRFGRLVDVAREAAFLARKKGADKVTAEEIRQAVRDNKRRADLPARRFRKLVADGTIRIKVEGSEAGQIHGLAVVHAGPLTYGFPTRITGTIGPGTGGAINIEREAQLSGAIHTKGFYILGGLLRHLLRTQHPLAFSASIAFEQSYGGIDGDSASGAEICCLLSALTELPLRQDLAMTGAIDQRGHILPVGAVTEKVEGFFDTCRDLGLTGTQGVIVPKANAGDLMLRTDVVEACEKGGFHVYAVDTIHEALELLTGRPAGQRDAEGHYPEDTVLGIAEAKALAYWRLVASRPGEMAAGAGAAEDAEGNEGES